MKDFGNVDLFQVLGAEPGADASALQKAYRRAVRRFHPDSNSHPGAPWEFTRIQHAYETLNDPARQADYLKQRPPDEPAPFFQVELIPSRTQVAVSTEPQVLYLLMMMYASQVTAHHRESPPLNLCLVIDRSTSMKGSRLDGVKSAAREIIQRLQPADSFSVVAFSDRAEVILSATQNVRKALAISRISKLQASGGTEILQGLIMGLTELHRHLSPRAINHMVLLTDGQTYGDEQPSYTLAERAESDGITISGMGIGEDWNDAFLDRLTGITGGKAGFIASSHMVTRHLREHVFGLGDIFASRIRLYATPDAGVNLLDAFQIQPDAIPLDLSKHPLRLGSLLRREPMSVLLKFEIGPQPREGDLARLGRLTLEGDVLSVGRMRESTVFDLALGVTAFSRTPPPPPGLLVDALEKVNLYNIQQKVAEQAERGDVIQATQHLRHLAQRLLAVGETELAQSAMIEAQNLRMTQRLTPGGQKQLKYGTRALLQGPANQT